MRILCILAVLVLSANGGFTEEWDEEYLRFPPNFLLGAATSAYQIEGGWNASDKGESVWDRFVHEGENRIDNNDTGDVAADSYHKFEEDVAILKELGVQWYRFSVSWPRILPKGFANQISQDGIGYYKRLINKLLANNIMPILTLYHWDHPQIIEDMGGWTNPEIVEWFGDYARIVFRELGPKVKWYITVNEPCYYCIQTYAEGKKAPGKVNLRGIGEYLCVQNQLKAHARAYRIYEEEFKESQNGLVGINIHMMNFYPKNEGDTLSTERAFQFTTGWILNPIYSDRGDYPEIMKQVIANKSAAQGYPRSRLPELEPTWREYIRGTSDFLAVNHYTSQLVEPGEPEQGPSFYNDLGLIISSDPSWESSNSAWLKIVPEGFGNALRKVSNEYRNPKMYVTENGMSDKAPIDDVHRIQYYQKYVKEMLVAIKRDGVNVQGYLLWSLLDSFEWERGYSSNYVIPDGDLRQRCYVFAVRLTEYSVNIEAVETDGRSGDVTLIDTARISSERFGIVHINFNDPERRRTLKKSAHWWKRVIRSRKLELSRSEISNSTLDGV